MPRRRSRTAPCGPPGGCTSRRSQERQTAPPSSRSGNLQSSYWNEPGCKLTKGWQIDTRCGGWTPSAILDINFFGDVFSIYLNAEQLTMTGKLYKVSVKDTLSMLNKSFYALSDPSLFTKLVIVLAYMTLLDDILMH